VIEMTEQKSKEEKRNELEEERRRREREEKERRKENSGEKRRLNETTPTVQQETIKREKEVKIPILKPEESGVEEKDIKISKEIPYIKRKELGIRELEIRAPVVQLPPSVIEEKEIKLDKEIPHIKTKKEDAIKIPLILLRDTDIKCILSELNSQIPQVESKPQPGIRIPIYKIPKMPVIGESISVDREISLGKLEEKPIQTAESEPPSGGGEEIEQEPPEFIEFVFSGSSGLSVNGPVIILYKELDDDSTIGSFETICMNIFREKRGGHPEVQPIEKYSEFNIREIENYIKAENKIIRIDLDLIKINDEKKVSNLISSDNLREALGRFVVGDVSFLIFKTRDEKLYEHCKKVINYISDNSEHPLYIFEINPKKLTLEQKRILTWLAWGLSIEEFKSEIKIIDDRPIGTTFDDLFNKRGKRNHKEYFENLQREKNGLYVLATNQHEGEESDLHLGIKWFIVKLLSEKYGLTSLIEIKENIKTEESLLEGPKPDVWDKKENSVYEIETLFSVGREGKTPERKIYESIIKYEGTTIENINIVLDNLTFLLHIKEIWGIKKNISKWEQIENKKVNFFTLDLDTHELIPFSELLKKVKILEKC